MKPKVNVIVATYNGERYLRNQILSVINQTYENIDIFIRDDGSTDNTVQVIEDIQKEYADCNRRIVLLKDDKKNLRCPSSFYEIVKQCDKADYYSLCDQDDEWYPEKIEWAVDMLEANKQDGIQIYFSSYDYYMADGSFIRHSPEQKQNIELRDVLFYTPGYGFTIVFNEAARQELILDVEPGDELHDRFLLRGAICFGSYIYDKRRTAKHIRHEEAVTAADSSNMSLIRNFFANELFGQAPKDDKGYLKYYLKIFGDRMTEKQKKTVSIFTKKGNPIVWVKKVFYPHRLRARIGGEIALRMMFFLGRI